MNFASYTILIIICIILYVLWKIFYPLFFAIYYKLLYGNLVLIKFFPLLGKFGFNFLSEKKHKDN